MERGIDSTAMPQACLQQGLPSCLLGGVPCTMARPEVAKPNSTRGARVTYSFHVTGYTVHPLKCSSPPSYQSAACCSSAPSPPWSQRLVRALAHASHNGFLAAVIAAEPDSNRRAAAVYELEGPDLEGKDKLFRKPWAMTLNMFIGMSFCIPLAYLEERRNRQKPAAGDPSLDASEPLLNGDLKVAV